MLWVDVPGYEGLYKISECGTIYSYKRPNTTIHPKSKKGLYPTYSLTKNKVEKCLTVHRLLALVFIPNPLGLPCVNHIDGDKTNYSLCNLEWTTFSKNTQHAYDAGLFKKLGENHHKSKLDYVSVLLMRGMYLTGNYTFEKLSKVFKISPASAREAVRGKTWKQIHGGPMDTDQLKKKMHKQIGVSLESLSWFCLSTFMKSILEDPEKVKLLFKSAEDCAVIETILAQINKQYAPHLEKDLGAVAEEEKLENLLKLPVKKLITTGKPLIY